MTRLPVQHASFEAVTVDYLIAFASLLILRFALDFGYVQYASVRYEDFFLPIVYRYDPYRYAFSVFLYAISIGLLRPSQHSVGNIIQWMCAIFLVAPITSQFGLDYERPIEPVIATLLTMFVVRLVSDIGVRPGRKYSALNDGRYYAILLCISGIVFLCVWAVISGSLSSFNLNPELVYDYRGSASKALDAGVLAYVNVWVYKSFTIYLICFCLLTKRYIFLIPLLAVQVFFTGVTNHKAVLFLPLLAGMFWYFLARYKRMYALPLGVSVLILLALAITQFYAYEWAAEIIVRRTFYVPSGATFAWFDFFEKRPAVLWSDNILSGLIESPYNGYALPYLVGDSLMPNRGLAAGNGLVSTGYANAGYYGVLLYALIFGGIVNILNRLALSGVPLWMVCSLEIGPLRTALADADLPTSILSHGIAISLLLLWLHREKADVWLGSRRAMTFARGWVRRF